MKLTTTKNGARRATEQVKLPVAFAEPDQLAFFAAQQVRAQFEALRAYAAKDSSATVVVRLSVEVQS